MILALGTLSSEAAPVPATAVRANPTPGEVTVPVPLAVRAVADVLEPGDIVDLVSVSDDGRAHVVAARARVVGQPGGAGGFTPTDALLLVAVPEETALALATATARSAVTVIIHGFGPGSAVDSPT